MITKVYNYRSEIEGRYISSWKVKHDSRREMSYIGNPPKSVQNWINSPERSKRFYSYDGGAIRCWIWT